MLWSNEYSYKRAGMILAIWDNGVSIPNDKNAKLPFYVTQGGGYVNVWSPDLGFIDSLPLTIEYIEEANRRAKGYSDNTLII